MSRRRRTHPSRKPSLILWQYRHLLAALCVGTAVLSALSLRSDNSSQQLEVWVTARSITAGEVLEEEDLQLRSVSVDDLPAEGLLTEPTAGLRSTVSLPAGVVLLDSLTTADITSSLQPDERLVEVPISGGISLVQPGARVDLIGQSPTSNFTDEPPTVLAQGARVVLVREQGNDNQFAAGTKVTLLTIVVSEQDANLVAGATTTGTISVALSP